ncbi:DNA polymerase III subunit epsilon [Cellulosimicrobium sp. MI9406]|uniref:exonuclease domain-containing protein n=1 Tax=Cellulosimicrobium TaxID=157920 RepID=UPI00088AA01A|nr:DNA polymerase-3 subunit epsilon [Cellulosimicrobium cellulans]
MAGYAVVDVETTGLRPSRHDRIVEVAVVHVDAAGRVERTWSTLVNPERDLGPQVVHGITAADVRHAPRFADVAGTLAGLLEGRVLVAHNAAFDLGFLQHSFQSCGHDVPLVWPTTLCTMRTAAALLPGAPRSLAGCCAHLGIEHAGAHEALADARAAAGVLDLLIAARDRLDGERAPALPWWDLAHELAETARWPSIPVLDVAPVVRGVAAGRDVPFLERLSSSLPRSLESWEREQYLALLDRALLDRYLSAREHDALADTAAELGIDAGTAYELHRSYLSELTIAAWADGVVTDDERADLAAVAGLLDIAVAELDTLLDAARPRIESGSSDETGRLPGRGIESSMENPRPGTGAFRLEPGDLVVLTGEMTIPRSEWEARARAVGIVPNGNVTKKVRLLVAADPDSLSGKARKAVDYGVPIVTEQAFAKMLDALG